MRMTHRFRLSGSDLMQVFLNTRVLSDGALIKHVVKLEKLRLFMGKSVNGFGG